MPTQFLILKIHLLRYNKSESINTEYLSYSTAQCHSGHKMAGSVKEKIKALKNLDSSTVESWLTEGENDNSFSLLKKGQNKS